MNKKHHSDYTQIAIHVPKDLAVNFKQLILEVDLGLSEAGEEALRMWCNTTIEKMTTKKVE